MSFLRRHPISLALAVAAVLSIQLVPQSTFFGDDYIQLGILEGTTEGFGAGPSCGASTLNKRPRLKTWGDSPCEDATDVFL